MAGCSLPTPNGLAMVAMSSGGHEGEYQPVVDLFTNSVYIDDSGCEYLDLGPSDDAPVLHPLVDLMNNHAPKGLELESVGRFGTAFTIRAAMFDRPRGDGCQIMCSLSDLVKQGALETGTRKGKWIHNMWASWESYIYEDVQGVRDVAEEPALRD